MPWPAPIGGWILALGEIGWARLVGGVAAYVAMLTAHPWLFGVNPLYWLA